MALMFTEARATVRRDLTIGGESARLVVDERRGRASKDVRPLLYSVNSYSVILICKYIYIFSVKFYIGQAVIRMILRILSRRGGNFL